LITEAKKGGAVVLVSSHVPEFIEEVSDRVIFLKDGRISRKEN